MKYVSTLQQKKSIGQDLRLVNSTQYNKSNMTTIEFLELAKTNMCCTYFEIPDKIPDRVKRISNQPLKQGGNSLLNSETYPYFNNL